MENEFLESKTQYFSKIIHSAFTVWRALLNMNGNLVGLLLVSLIGCHFFQNGLAEESSSASNSNSRTAANHNILHRNRREAPLRYAYAASLIFFSYGMKDICMLQIVQYLTKLLSVRCVYCLHIKLEMTALCASFK